MNLPNVGGPPPSMGIQNRGEVYKISSSEKQLLQSIAKNSTLSTQQALFKTEVNGSTYVIAKTKQGVVIQKETDWARGIPSGVYMNHEGQFAPSTPDHQNALEALTNYNHLIQSKASEFLRSLPSDSYGILYPPKANPSKMQPDEYIVVKSAKGITIQKCGDYISQAKTGLFIPSPIQNYKFDGDPKCLEVLKNANADFRTPIAAQPKPPPVSVPVRETHQAKTVGMLPSVANVLTSVFPSLAGSAAKGKERIVESVVILLSGSERLKRMTDIHAIYQGFAPRANIDELRKYVASDEYEKDCRTAKVYHDAGVSSADSALIMQRREPVNIQMNRPYNKAHLKATFGHEVSAYSDPEIGPRLREKPNTVAVYSQTYLWPKPGESSAKKKISCLSLPAPALDHPQQPHYNYYMGQGTLNTERYRAEMQTLARMVVRACVDNKDSDGIKRLVIPQYGQGAFLGISLSAADKDNAHKIFYETLVAELANNKDALNGVEIVMSDYGGEKNVEIAENFIKPLKTAGLNVGTTLVKDILNTAKQGDLIVNAWDPHSVPGNGNDADKTFDGVMGKGTGISAVQSAWQNEYIAAGPNGMPRDPSRYVSV